MSEYGRTIRGIAVPLAVVGMAMMLPQMSATPGRLHDVVQLAACRAEAIADSITAGAQQWMGSSVVAACPQRVVEVVSIDDAGVEMIAPDLNGLPSLGLSVDLHLTSLPPPTC